MSSRRRKTQDAPVDPWANFLKRLSAHGPPKTRSDVYSAIAGLFFDSVLQGMQHKQAHTQRMIQHREVHVPQQSDVQVTYIPPDKS